MGDSITVGVRISSELLQRIDDEVIKRCRAKKYGRKFDRSEFISFALEEYLKLPAITRYCVSKVK